MRLNVFRIPSHELGLLRESLASCGLTPVATVASDGWRGAFYFSSDPAPTPIPWIEEFQAYLGPGGYFNRAYFGVLLMERADEVLALSFGKAHFFVRPHCDYDFGMEVAKRIADERDTRLTSGKRFAGRQTKDIRGYSRDSPLSIPPGESVELLQAAVHSVHRRTFGASAKFGASVSIAVDVAAPDIGRVLTAICDALATPERFKIPRTVVLSEPAEVARLDELLLDELENPVGVSSLAATTFDLFGVDFVFDDASGYELRCGNSKPERRTDLSMRHVKQYIAVNRIPRQRLLQLKVTEFHEDKPDLTRPIREAVDFISDTQRVLLSGGKWMRFNQDYLGFLDEAVSQIEVEIIEPQYALLQAVTEPAFNTYLGHHGYELADKDYSVLRVPSGAPVEAWDLRRDSTVYAVKFGTAQRLNYVVDQATIVLEVLGNRANAKQVPNFKRYCLWFGYKGSKPLQSLADSKSIILKQKVEAWSRQCVNLGVTPVLKISQKLHPKYDEPVPGAFSLS